MAGSATELIGWMFADDLLEIGMGAKRLRRIFEAAFVDTHVAGLAAVDARHRFVEGVAVEIFDRGLLDLGNLGIAEQDVEQDVTLAMEDAAP